MKREEATEIGEQMKFPETFERFAKEYGFKDDKEVYTNGSDLIPVFRVKQWLEYYDKLRRIETDTAYECGKHANKWIPVSERLPDKATRVLTSWVYVPTGAKYIEAAERYGEDDDYTFFGDTDEYKMNRKDHKVIAWMPLPKPYRAESEDKE